MTMSKKKQGGKASQHTSPKGKRLGLKVGDGEQVKIGTVLVTQNGTLFGAGKGVNKARDFTLYSSSEGKVKFGQKLGKKIVSVVAN